MIICEMHPKFGGYFTHVERTFCLGEPERRYLDIHDACLAAYRRGLELFRPHARISQVMDAVRDAIEGSGFGVCEAGIHGHGHGLASLEYPRYRHHAKGADAPALAAIGKMVFAMNIDLFDPKWRNGETGWVFAETIVITDDGARRMHSFSTDLQRLPV
jgi:Xaa-Pro aminopeptidase